MYQRFVLILFILSCDLIGATSVADSWILFAKSLKEEWRQCPVEYGPFHCFKVGSLEIFDEMTKLDVIPLGDNVRFERHRHQRKMSSDANNDKKLWDRSTLSTQAWSEHILIKMLGLFKTHTLAIGRTLNEGPRRRRQNNMLPMAVLGVTAFGVFAVPMGFQFILIVCGKAVLISKMALLLSSINGSRGVAHNGVHHGLHNRPIHNYGHYWKRDERPSTT